MTMTKKDWLQIAAICLLGITLFVGTIAAFCAYGMETDKMEAYEARVQTAIEEQFIYSTSASYDKNADFIPENKKIGDRQGKLDLILTEYKEVPIVTDTNQESDSSTEVRLFEGTVFSEATCSYSTVFVKLITFKQEPYTYLNGTAVYMRTERIIPNNEGE